MAQGRIDPGPDPESCVGYSFGFPMAFLLLAAGSLGLGLASS